jgi:hypothetical protein
MSVLLAALGGKLGTPASFEIAKHTAAVVRAHPDHRHYHRLIGPENSNIGRCGLPRRHAIAPQALGLINIKENSAPYQIIRLFGASHILFDGEALLRFDILK